MELINGTPFSAQLAALPDKDGAETLVAILKGRFTITPDGCRRAEEPAVIVQADEPWGEPGQSSTRLESDLATRKPATDVVLIGHAYAPDARSQDMIVSLAVGPVRQQARVCGDRHWHYALGLTRASSPQPFDRIPLLFERAFGGSQLGPEGDDVIGQEERNPVGRGYSRKRRRAHLDGLPLPNIEDPGQRLRRPNQRPAPVGFGFVGRHWEPRRSLLGTYDAAWERDRMPLVPVDFDERAFNGAPESLQARPHLRGDESVEALGVTPTGPLRFALPALQPSFELHDGSDWRPLAGVLDTIVIEPDALCVSLTWRASANVHGRIRRVRAVRIGGDS